MPNMTRLAAQATLVVLKQLLSRLESGDRSWLARHCVSSREKRDVRALVDFSYAAVRGWKKSSFDIDINGEAALLERLRPLSPRTITDIGANIGERSLAALKHLPTAVVYVFEIAPSTAKKLIQNVIAHRPLHDVQLRRELSASVMFA